MVLFLCVRVCVCVSNLDNGNNILGGRSKLAHVHIKMVQCVVPGLHQYETRALSHSVDAPQVTSRIEVRVWGRGNRHFRNSCRQAVTGSHVHRHLERRIGRPGAARGYYGVVVVSVTGSSHGLLVLSPEETHWCGMARSKSPTPTLDHLQAIIIPRRVAGCCSAGWHEKK